MQIAHLIVGLLAIIAGLLIGAATVPPDAALASMAKWSDVLGLTRETGRTTSGVLGAILGASAILAGKRLRIRSERDDEPPHTKPATGEGASPAASSTNETVVGGKIEMNDQSHFHNSGTINFHAPPPARTIAEDALTGSAIAGCTVLVRAINPAPERVQFGHQLAAAVARAGGYGLFQDDLRIEPDFHGLRVTPSTLVADAGIETGLIDRLRQAGFNVDRQPSGSWDGQMIILIEVGSA